MNTMLNKKIALVGAVVSLFAIATIGHNATIDYVSAESTLDTIGTTDTTTDTSNFEFDEDTLTITKYTGDNLIVTIPSEINGKKVRSIGNQAFSQNKYIQQVTIPNTVISIDRTEYTELLEYGAFSGCTSLKEVDFEEGSILSTIGERAFAECVNLTNITIPDSVTYIGANAFSDCHTLTDITLPNSLTYIGSKGFFNCSSMHSLTVPNSVTSLEEYAIGYLDIYTIDSSYVVYGEEGSVTETYAKDNNLYFNGKPPVDNTDTVLGDVTNDGKVTTADLLKIKKYLLGIITSLEA